MTDLLKRFSKAAKAVSSSNNPIRQLIYNAYNYHLSDINTDDLPEEIQPIFDAFTDRLSSTEPPGDIGNDEASHLAKDILYMTDVLRDPR
jgi:hypothetical protein